MDSVAGRKLGKSRQNLREGLPRRSRVIKRPGAEGVHCWAYSRGSSAADETMVVSYNMGNGTEQLCLIKVDQGCSLDFAVAMTSDQGSKQLTEDEVQLSQQTTRIPNSIWCWQRLPCKVLQRACMFDHCLLSISNAPVIDANLSGIVQIACS